MGFVKAFSGALGGSLSDQWRDFLTVPGDAPATAGVCVAVGSHENRGISSNVKGAKGVVTNGSLVVVPEGYALITLENGLVTGFVSEPGGYRWFSDDANSKSVFAGDGFKESLLGQAWERFKFGGAPGAVQRAVYVNLKEIPGNRFGTQNAIYWDDPYFGTQVGATARGTYTLRVEDPILFLKGFVPSRCYMEDAGLFDFADFRNDAATQLFNEAVASLSSAFSLYVNQFDSQGRMANIQQDSIGFAESFSSAVESGYSWRRNRGLAIVKAALSSVDYDDATKQLMSKVQQADALMGTRGNSNLQASLAEGLRAAGSNPGGGALGMGIMGMSLQGISGMFGSMQQPPQNPSGEDPYEKLTRLKGLLDQGVITQDDFDAAKSKVLGL